MCYSSHNLHKRKLMMSQSMSFLYFYDIVVLVIEIIGGLNTCRPTEKEYLTVNHPPPHTYSLYHSLMMKMKLILLATLLMLSLAFGSIPLSRQSSEENYSEDVDRAIGIFTTGNYWKELWRHTIWITRRW